MNETCCAETECGWLGEISLKQRVRTSYAHVFWQAQVCTEKTNLPHWCPLVSLLKTNKTTLGTIWAICCCSKGQNFNLYSMLQTQQTPQGKQVLFILHSIIWLNSSLGDASGRGTQKIHNMALKVFIFEHRKHDFVTFFLLVFCYERQAQLEMFSLFMQSLTQVNPCFPKILIFLSTLALGMLCFVFSKMQRNHYLINSLFQFADNWKFSQHGMEDNFYFNVAL